MHNIGLESDWLFLRLGKSWSAYYTVAGAADRFAIFGGEAVGVYNAATDGGATGTGRADNALQTEFYIDLDRFAGIKPFNLNVQVQHGEPIPEVEGAHYASTYSLSAWLETNLDVGVGLAWHHALIDDDANPSRLLEQGISGNASALAVAFKTFGDRWLASLVLADSKNIQTTDQLEYVDGLGVELFGQWEFSKKWWLIAGGNWFHPEEEDPEAGEYEINYTVLGLRYTFDSFNRMVYVEWRNDSSRLADGSPAGNEITVGVRWDVGQ